MKIQNMGNYINYKNATKTVKKEEIVKPKKYDVIEIRNKAPQGKENLSLNAIKKDVLSEINKETSEEKVSRIKDSINNKTYKIDVEEIVKKLFK